MASSPITPWQTDGETMKTVWDFIFWVSKIIIDGDCSHEIKRHLLLGRKAMTNLESMLKSRDITLPTKVHLVKAMVFPAVMYGCESWTIKKAECQRIDAFQLWCCRRLLTVPWTARRSNQSILKEISPEYSLEELRLKLKLQYFDHLMWRADSLEKTLMLGKIEGRRRRDELVGWHHQLYGHEFEQAPGVGWCTGKPGVLQSMEVTNSWTQLNDWTELPSVWWALPQVTTWPTPSPPAGQKSHLFKYEKWKWSHSVMSDSATLWTVPARHLHPWDFPGKITGVGCYFLLQGVFPTQESNLGLLHCRQTLPSEPQGKLLGIFPIQGSNPGLLHCRWILYQLSHTWGLPWPPYWNWTPFPFLFLSSASDLLHRVLICSPQRYADQYNGQQPTAVQGDWLNTWKVANPNLVCRLSMGKQV